MKIQRTGRRRVAGVKTLGTKDLVSERPSPRTGPSLTKDGDFVFGCTGNDNGSSYVYTVSLAPKELFYMMELMVTTAAPEAPARAVAHGALASLQSLFDSYTASLDPEKKKGA